MRGKNAAPKASLEVVYDDVMSDRDPRVTYDAVRDLVILLR